MDPLAPIIRRLIAPAWAIWETHPYLRNYRRLLRTQYDCAGSDPRRPVGESPATARPRLPYDPVLANAV